MSIKISIADSSLKELDNGESYLTFSVSLSEAAQGDVSVDYLVDDADVESVSLEGTLTFEKGETTKEIEISIPESKQIDVNSSFNVQLSNAHSSTVDDSLSVAGENSDDAFQICNSACPCCASGQHGKLYEAPTSIPASAAEMAERAASTSSPASPSDYAFESLPGAEKVIYLDFDGYTFSSNFWQKDFGGHTTNAYTNSAEQIKSMWMQVAEDYAPFNVNVTTDESVYNNAGLRDRAMIVVTGEFKEGGPTSFENGGEALGDKFGYDIGSGSGLNIGIAIGYEGGYKSLQSIGVTISHEAGHLLGLKYHHGLGDKPYHPGGDYWGPLMGAPFESTLTQWSNGGYANSTNHNDDLSIIAGKLGYREDDHKNTKEEASNINMSLNGHGAEGLIEKNTDSDMFKYNLKAGQTLYIEANPLKEHANLDVELIIDDGTTKSTINPHGDLSASANYTATQDITVYFSVQGGAVHDKDGIKITSDYGSLGYYSIDVFSETGTMHDDTLKAKPGGRTIEGKGGNDTIYGNIGNDVLYGGEGVDSLYGGVGNDTLDSGGNSEAVREVIIGGIGSDTLIARNGLNSHYHGDEGNDRIGLGYANNAGDFDTIDFSNAITAISVDLESETGHAGWFGSTLGHAWANGFGQVSFLSGIERVIGSRFDDLITGSSGDDVLEGRVGRDTIYGDGGNDTLKGGADADILDGGAHDDILDSGGSASHEREYLSGGIGSDTLFMSNSGLNSHYHGDNWSSAPQRLATDFDTLDFSNATNAIVVHLDIGHDFGDLALGVAWNNGFGQTNFVTGFEKITGSKYNDTIIGGDSVDTLNGGGGIDTLKGGGNTDSLFGGNDRDYLYGESGNDILKGEGGNDVLNGGAGVDKLYGGSGADTFQYTSLSDSIRLSYDTIHDFESGSDKIDLQALDVSAADLINLPFMFGSYISIAETDFSILVYSSDGGAGAVSADDILF